jgi:hypothetical protein
LSLRRARNLAATLVPFVALGAFAGALGDPAAAALALAPAPLIGPWLAPQVGAREERTAALMTATVIVSLVLLLIAVPRAQATANTALVAFVLGVAVAGTLPTVRDAMLPVLDAARYIAVLALLAAAGLTSVAAFDPRAAGIALAFLAIGTIAAAAAARAFGGDPLAAALGAGARDPAVAAGIVVGSGIVGGGEITLAYAVMLALALILRKLAVRSDARGEPAR